MVLSDVVATTVIHILELKNRYKQVLIELLYLSSSIDSFQVLRKLLVNVSPIQEITILLLKKFPVHNKPRRHYWLRFFDLEAIIL